MSRVEGERENLLRVLHAELKAPTLAGSHDPWDCDVSQNQQSDASLAVPQRRPESSLFYNLKCVLNRCFIRKVWSFVVGFSNWFNEFKIPCQSSRIWKVNIWNFGVFNIYCPLRLSLQNGAGACFFKNTVSRRCLMFVKDYGYYYHYYYYDWTPLGEALCFT